MKCPNCGSEEKPHSYDEEFREKAVQLYGDGMTLRRIGRQPGVHHQSVANWAKAHAEDMTNTLTHSIVCAIT